MLVSISCLFPGSGVIREGELWPRVGESFGVGSRLIGVHREGILAGQFFTIPRNWLAPGEAVPPRACKILKRRKTFFFLYFLGSCLRPFYNKGQTKRIKTNV